MEQLTEEQAINFAKSGLWESWTHEQIVRFQLFQDKLCMNFSRFNEAIEKVLNRPVYTHEFAYPEELKKEFLGEKEPPTMQDIIELIPAEKTIIIGY
jgi:hypothetical protein